MAICCTCGYPLQRFWVVWNDRQRGWSVTADSPDTSRTDPIFAASIDEAAYAVHHDPSVLTHDVVCPSRAQPGWRAPGPPDHDPAALRAFPASPPVARIDPGLPAA